jgi:hypothetical protein
VGNGGEKQPLLKEQHDILNEFVGAPGSDRPPHMELPTENPDGPNFSGVWNSLQKRLPIAESVSYRSA